MIERWLAASGRRLSRPKRFRPAIELLESRRALAVQKFAVIGDYGADGTPEILVAELVDSWAPDAVFTVGDNNYGVGTFAGFDNAIGKYYREYMGNYQGVFGAGSPVNRFFPAPGNHDYISIETYKEFFDLPGPGYTSSSQSENYYDVVLGNVHLFSLDSNLTDPSGPSSLAAQEAWLQQRLAESTAEFQILAFHHPAFNSGDYGNHEYMQFPFREWGVDVVLAGHEHVYERLLVDGVYHLTNGLGGAGELYNFHGDPLPESQVRFSGEYGAMLITAEPGSLTFEFHTIVDDGTLVDRFVLAVPEPAGWIGCLLASAGVAGHVLYRRRRSAPNDIERNPA